MLAVIELRDKFIVEPVLGLRGGEVLVRVEFLPVWMKPYDLVYCESPLRAVPDGAPVEFAYHSDCGIDAGKYIIKGE